MKEESRRKGKRKRNCEGEESKGKGKRKKEL
jgi:hypothetical protein